nr:5177_t:CDS:2 [Entrophospora candida]
MVNEQPVISTTFKPKDNPQAPAVHLGFGVDFKMSFMLYYNTNGTKIDKCDQYITQTKKTDDVNFPFIGSFSPNGNLNLSKCDDDEKGLPRFIFIYMSIIDLTTIVLNKTSQKTTVRMTAYDSKNEQDNAQSRESSDTFIGVNSMKPWGIIRNGCCGIRRFKEHTEIKLSKFVNLPSTNADSVRISQAVRDLEGFRHFLESNVIDTSMLEALRSQQQQIREQQLQQVEI